MLRNRSKQALMADQIPSTTPISSIISPRFFNGLLTKTHQDSDTTTTSISPKSILDTKNSSSCVNPFGYERNPTKSQTPETPAREFSRQLSLKEMELSEDYTCVITHGPNPKTTHIFDDCIVESSCIAGEDDVILSSSSDSFMRFCHSCKDSFCSHECQSEERDFDGNRNQERDDAL